MFRRSWTRAQQVGWHRDDGPSQPAQQLGTYVQPEGLQSMTTYNLSTFKQTLLAAALGMGTIVSQTPTVFAADHAESTSVAGDPGADIADVFAFLDPTDNSKVVLALDVEGFVVPSELANLSFFGADITYRFSIENTGDARPDASIDVTFAPQTARNQPQMATIRMPNGRVFSAPTTVQTLAATANPFVVSTDPVSGVGFFAGLTDDPFYFDIVGFNRFVASVLAGTPDVTRLQRGRDSFAGYNIHMIALSVPASLLKGRAGDVIGVNGITLRKVEESGDFRGPRGERRRREVHLKQIDRMATPAVNTALIPFARKNEYNAATPVDDAAGKFAGDIVATLKALGTNDANIGILASVAVAKGDYLRLNTATANSSLGFGQTVTSPGYTGFPNGRRPGDDTIDTLLYFIANQNPLGDNVNGNDVPLGTVFPFFAPPQQPRNTGVVDDNTRN